MSTEEFTNWCPGCEPDRDPAVEILSIFWCPAHAPETSGALDHIVHSEIYLTGGNEVEGINNKLWCDFFHRGIGKL